MFPECLTAVVKNAGNACLTGDIDTGEACIFE
jgi:hypothetical protein